MTQPPLIIEKQKNGYIGRFSVMASPCEILVDIPNFKVAEHSQSTIESMMWSVYHEAKRIEQKFSRYVSGNIVHTINQSNGESVVVDDETARLIDFAFQCYELSDGLFDISSGVLRKVWSFQGCQSYKKKFPTVTQVKQVLTNVGWPKIQFNPKQITLMKGMEIDFGGIGKEYAVDRAIIIAKQLTNLPVLVNLGGDLAVTSSRINNEPWQVAIEHPDIDNNHADMIVSLKSGALATSGDARRFIINNGKRYGHILNAKTGWPVEQAPRSITVVAPQCIQAGILATLALIQGAEAEQFLEEQEIKFWARR